MIKSFNNYSDTSIDIIVNDFFEKCDGLFSKEYEPLVRDAIKQLRGNIDLKDVLCCFPEFPLIGDSWLDLSIGYSEKYAYEFDLSTRGLDTPTKGHFFQDYKSGDEDKILKPLEAMDFFDALRYWLKLLSKEWTLAYCGLFNGRFGKNLRVVPYYRGEMSPDAFFHSLERIGFNYLTEEKKRILRPLIIPSFDYLEVSLNLSLDGSLENYIGIIFNVPSINNISGGMTKKLLKECRYEDFLCNIEENGLIDNRWKIAKNAIYIKKYSSPFLTDIDGCIVANGVRGIKLSWKEDALQPTKMYMDFLIGNT